MNTELQRQMERLSDELDKKGYTGEDKELIEMGFRTGFKVGWLLGEGNERIQKTLNSLRKSGYDV